MDYSDGALAAVLPAPQWLPRPPSSAGPGLNCVDFAFASG